MEAGLQCSLRLFSHVALETALFFKVIIIFVAAVVVANATIRSGIYF